MSARVVECVKYEESKLDEYLLSDSILGHKTVHVIIAWLIPRSVADEVAEGLQNAP